MELTEILLIILCTSVLIISILGIILILKKSNKGTQASTDEITNIVRNEIGSQMSTQRQELSTQIQSTVKNMGDMISGNQTEKMSQLEERIKTFSLENEQKLENIRHSVEKRLEYLQTDNNRQLEKMRETVDEKLQKTLEEKMNKSFSLVNERLEQVYKGLGEMQNLAVGVGDLKKVLSNVKTRGILGEIQLKSILSEILSPEQYEENIATKKGSKKG